MGMQVSGLVATIPRLERVIGKGARLLVEVEVVEPFADEIGVRIVTGVGNLTQKLWIGWAAVRSIVDPGEVPEGWQ